MKGTGRNSPCLLGFLMGFCLATLPGSYGCPKLCACYVPTEVHCTFRYLGTIPDHIPQNVERINLGYNSLIKLTEKDFSGLEKLELLMLHSNQIHTIQDRTFSDLHSLQVLKMSYNKVKVIQADTFHGLVGLVRLHMDHNQIEFVNPKAFYGLTSLKLLHLEGNVLKQLHPDTFVTLRYLQIFKTSSIKHIYLSDNLLTSLPQDIFTYMTELESVYLHGNSWICDCALKWFAEWAEQHPDIVKCKKDRGFPGALQCPLCANLKTSKEKTLAKMPLSYFECVKPTIDTTLKIKNITVPDDGDFTSISSKDFMAPIGSMVLNMTDQAGNMANLACNVQSPTKMSPVTLKKMVNTTVLAISFSTFLVCGVDYEHIQPSWSILALYSDSPLKLKRDNLLTKVPYISYKYKQTDSENEELFTGIEATLRAEPPWLMQGQVSLQLDRTVTTLNTLQIQYLLNAQITLPVAAPKPARRNWVMILQGNNTRTEYTVLVGRSVELDCQALGDPAPVIEWVLADGSKIRAPYISEDGRMMIAKSGKLLLHTADTFDTGVYHCIATNYDDADVLTFRIIVTDPYLEQHHLNGPQLSVFPGETLYLPCQSRGAPEASVSWILPEHVVLYHSSKNKLLFQNGTLKIQETSDRDNGYFKCVAANQYGVDFLVYQVLVKTSSNVSQKLDIQVEDEAAEGSGHEEYNVTTKPPDSSTTIQTKVISQAFREVSALSPPILSKQKGNYKEIYIHNRDKISKRFRGRKRQFGSSKRRIDPLHWAELLEKTKNTTLLRKQENATVKPMVKVILSSKLSGKEEETSGDDIFSEEEFMLLATKRPAMYRLREASGNVVTAKLGSISSNYSSVATADMVRETVTPAANLIVTSFERLKNKKLYLDVEYDTESMDVQPYQRLPTPPTHVDSATSSAKLIERKAKTLNAVQKWILPKESNLHVKATPTTAINITKNSHSIISHKNTDKPVLFGEAPDRISRKSNHQVSVVTVSIPDDLLRNITHNAHKMTTPKLPAGSTTVSHQQIMTVRGAAIYTPPSRRYGKRRKFSGRRRIVRPDRIFNMAGRKFPFRKSGFAQESTRLPPLKVSTLTSSNKYLEQITSQVPVSPSSNTHNPESTTVNEVLALSRNKLDTAEEHITSTMVSFYPENSQVVSHTQVETSTLLQSAIDTNPPLRIKHPVLTIASPKNGTEATTVTVSPLAIKSSFPRFEMSTSSSTSGSNHVQKELQGKHHSLQTSEESMTVVSVIPPQTTAPMYRTSPVHDGGVSSSENQTDDIMNIIKPVSDNMVTIKHNLTLPLSITKSPSFTYVFNFTAALEKGADTTSIMPVLIPITSAHVSKSKVFGSSRRRSQRKRPSKKLTPSERNVTINKGIGTMLRETVTFSILETPKQVIVPTGTLFSKLTSVAGFTATLQPPIIHTTHIIGKNKFTTTAQVLARNITAENTVTAKLSVDDLASEKPMLEIPFTASFLNTINTTTASTLMSTKPTEVTTLADQESFQNVGGKTSQEKQMTKATVKTELKIQTPINEEYHTSQQSKLSISQSVALPHSTITQTTPSPRWRKTSGQKPFSKTTESGKTFRVNVLTILKPPLNSTQYTPSWRTNNYVKSWSEKTRDQEVTTSNLIALHSFYQTRFTNPRIIGGKLAAFTVLANSDAFIPCEVSGNPQPTIQWTKISQGVDAPKLKKENKLEVFPNGTLFIQNTSIQDRGQYLCMATNQYGSDKLLVTLSVVTYPPRILGRKSKIVIVHSGKPVTMKCVAEGRPIPTISWILANKTYVSESSVGNEAVSVQRDGTLVIKKASVFDRGIYTCIAKNPAGSDTTIIRLQVIAAPPIIMEEKKQHVLENMGGNLKLPCTAKGNPHPSVHWVLFDGTEVKPLQYINGKLLLFPNGTLYIRNLTPSDSGNYECIATSSTGSERRVVTLQVEHTDTIPRIAVASQRLTQLNFGDRLLLNCSATGTPKPKIIWRLPSRAVVDQWHRMGSRIHVYPNGSLTVEALTEKDAGDYICVARNKMGDDLVLMKVSVTMKPAKIDQKLYFKKSVPYGKDFKVDCKASGSPEPEISWSLPDGTVINNVMQADDSGHRSRRYTLFDNGTLYFNKVGIAEEGDYTCYAQNTLGKDEMKVHITIVAAAPRIKQNSKAYAKIKAGETAHFDCNALGEPKPKIFWLLPSNDMITASTQRYILHGNGSLSVSKVRLIDAGEYICVARNSGGDDTKLYKLDVVSKPPLINGIYSNKTLIKMTAIKYSRKQIDCRAEGTPIPQTMWIMPDNIFLTAPYYGSRITVYKNGTLEIRNVRSSDSAEFICVARNDGGESILVVQLEVLEMLRRPVFRNPFNEKVIAKPGRTIFLNCSVDGNPPPEIIWILPNGTRITSGLQTLKYSLGSNGTLVINFPSKADAGKYRCAAKNKVGYIEKLIVLEIGQKPTIFIHPREVIKTIIGESLSLHCLAGGIPKPNIIWTVPSGFVINQPQINGKYILLENGTLVIKEATINDRGSYTCKAHNYVGDSTVVAFVIIVAHPPRITNRQPQNIHTKAGAAVQLHCMALGIPNPEITWELPDHSLLSTGSKGQPSGSKHLHPLGTLTIQNPKSSDSGTYKCMAKNQLGSDSTVTYLQVI
nr:immunoglobulin superfamily member 10 [Pogona vitticeps]